MPAYLELSCPGCLRDLRIRESYLGQVVLCNHCDRSFIPRAVDEFAGGDPPQVEDSREATEHPPTPDWESDAGRLQLELVARSSELTEIQARLVGTQAQVSEAQEAIETLTAEVARGNDQCIRLHKALDSAHDQYATDLELLTQRHDEDRGHWEVERRRLAEEVARLSKEWSRAERDREVAVQQREEAALVHNEQSRALRTEIEQLSRERLELHRAREESLCIVEAQAARQSQIQQLLAERAVCDQQNQHEIAELKETLDNERLRRAEADASRHLTAQRLVGLEQECEQLRQQREADLARLGGALDALREQTESQRRAEIENVENEARRHREELAKVHAVIDRGRRDIDDLTRVLADERQARTEAESRATDQAARLFSANLVLEELRSRSDAQEREHQRTLVSRDEAATEEKWLAEERAEIERRRFREELQASRSSIATLRHEAEAQLAKNSNALREIEILEQERDELAARLTAAQATQHAHAPAGLVAPVIHDHRGISVPLSKGSYSAGDPIGLPAPRATLEPDFDPWPGDEPEFGPDVANITSFTQARERIAELTRLLEASQVANRMLRGHFVQGGMGELRRKLNEMTERARRLESEVKDLRGREEALWHVGVAKRAKSLTRRGGAGESPGSQERRA
jgi:hypothetical protein